MTKVSMPRDRSHPSKRSYLTLFLALVMGLGALIAVLALPALERVIWPDVIQERAH